MEVYTSSEKWLTWLYANRSPGGSAPYLLLEIFSPSALPNGDMEKYFGRPVDMMHYWKEGYSWKYFRKEDVEEVGNTFLDRVAKESDFMPSLYKGTEKTVTALDEVSVKLFQIELKKLDNGVLKSLYQEIAKNYWNLGFYGVLPPVFGEFILEPLINQYLLSLNLDPASFNEILYTFTKERRVTALQRWEQSLEELVLEIRNSTVLYPLFEKSTSEIIKRLEKEGEFYDKLIRHRNEYLWVFYKWTGPIKPLEFFVDQLKEKLTKEQKNSNSLDYIVRNEKALIQRFGIDNTHQKYLEALRILVEIKNLKNEGMSLGAYRLHSFREELARRFNFDAKYTKYMLEGDFTSLLETGFINLEQLKEREKLFLWLAENGNEFFYTGEQAQTIINRKEPKRKSQFSGFTAYPGKAISIARIITDYEDYKGKFDRGDILVAPRTTDSYFPLFDKAGAIVTSEGGLTSHAANISREYKIPTIIGVQGVHLNLKHDSPIEVDADPLKGGSVGEIVNTNVRVYTSREFSSVGEQEIKIKSRNIRKVSGPEIIWLFEDSLKPNRKLLGNKAANQMICYKIFNVPEGFVSTTALYRKFLDEAGLTDKIEQLPGKLEKYGGKYSELEKLSQEYAQMIINSNVYGIFDGVLQAYRQLAKPSTLARSSAVIEDVKGKKKFTGRSFADVFKTSYNRNENELVANIMSSWASLFSPIAFRYSLDSGFDPSTNQMAVLVQEMINGDRSGIMYTGIDGQILIEACEGLCRPLASGEITPAIYVLDQASLDLINSKPNKQIFAEYIDSDGAYKQRKVSEPNPLQGKDLFELGKIGKKIQRHFGVPQDIEFAALHQIHVTQNRALTTKPFIT